jgi:3-oxoadipate enol-lactonase
VGLYCEVAGEGEAVVLIHAGVCDSRAWAAQMESFPRQYRTVRYDLRGFGRSPVPPEPFSHGRDLLGLLEELEIERATLVGNSVGGVVALELAVARPDLVDALVLVGSGLRGHDWSDEVRAVWDEENAALERGDLDAAVEANLRMWVDGPGRPPRSVAPDLRAFVGAMQRRAFELQLPAGDAADEQPLVPDVGERLGDIRVPTLVLVGDADAPDIHAIAARLEAEIPGARRAVIENAAHLPALERPAEFDALVLGFLEAKERGAAAAAPPLSD